MALALPSSAHAGSFGGLVRIHRKGPKKNMSGEYGGFRSGEAVVSFSLLFFFWAILVQKGG